MNQRTDFTDTDLSAWLDGEGNVVDLEQQPSLDLDGIDEPLEIMPAVQDDMFGAVQPGLVAAAK